MRVYDLIMKKRKGLNLSQQEIEYLINGYTNEQIPDYQMSAWLMAVCFQGLSKEETTNLTMAMVHSGEVLDLKVFPGLKVDKHSTGGVGDKTTLVLAPLVAAAGVPVAKMSGRGLGHTGGTIDKLESIPGFRVTLSEDEFMQQLKQINVAVVAQTGQLAPADKKLYALRDVTATVDSIPLISSSIMSKKIAAGADAIVLDVKVGSGAFMQNLAEAEKLAKTMVEIGTEVGRETIALLTDMDQPLGNAVGNALEVAEAIETLKGNGPTDLKELCLELGSWMITLAGKADNPTEGKKILANILTEGKALEKFREFIIAQGGDAKVIEQSERLSFGLYQDNVFAPCNGFIHAVHADKVGLAAMKLGAGRNTKEDEIDLGAGVILLKKVGSEVRAGEALATLYTSNSKKMSAAKEQLMQAYSIDNDQPKTRKIIQGLVKKENISN